MIAQSSLKLGKDSDVERSLNVIQLLSTGKVIKKLFSSQTRSEASVMVMVTRPKWPKLYDLLLFLGLYRLLNVLWRNKLPFLVTCSYLFEHLNSQGRGLLMFRTEIIHQHHCVPLFVSIYI